MCTLSVVMSVVVQNLHHRIPAFGSLPRFIHKVICHWLAWLLCMSRPEKCKCKSRVLVDGRVRSRVNDQETALKKKDPEEDPGADVRQDDTEKLLLDVLAELKRITKKMTEDAEAEVEANEWKFAAMVVDRLCLCVFSLYLVVATVSVFVHMYKNRLST